MPNLRSLALSGFLLAIPCISGCTGGLSDETDAAMMSCNLRASADAAVIKVRLPGQREIPKGEEKHLLSLGFAATGEGQPLTANARGCLRVPRGPIQTLQIQFREFSLVTTVGAGALQELELQQDLVTPACGRMGEHLLSRNDLIFKFLAPNGSELSEAETRKLDLSLAGQRTARGCVALSPGAFSSLRAQLRERNWAVEYRVALAPAPGKVHAIRLRDVESVHVDWACPGGRLMTGRNLTLDWTLEAKSDQLDVRFLMTAREGRRVHALERSRGLHLAIPRTAADGLYDLHVEVKDSFGRTQRLANPPACVLELDTRPPHPPVMGSELLRNAATLSVGESLSFEVESASTLLLCRRPVTGPECAPEDYAPVSDLALREPGRHRICATSRDGAGNQSIPICTDIAVDAKPPRLIAHWAAPELNRYQGTRELPSPPLAIEIHTLEDDVASGEFLAKNLLCKVEYVGNGVRAGRDTWCTRGRCQGKSLEEFVPCDPEFEFSIRESYANTVNTYTRLTIRATDAVGRTSDAVIRFRNLHRKFTKTSPDLTAEAFVENRFGLVFAATYRGPQQLDALEPNHWVTVRGFQELSIDQFTRSLAFDRSDRLWATADTGILRQNPDSSWKVYSPARNNLTLDMAEAVLADSTDSIWALGTSGEDRTPRLEKLSQTSDSFETVPIPGLEHIGRPLSLWEHGTGAVCAMGENAIACRHGSSWRIRTVAELGFDPNDTFAVALPSRHHPWTWLASMTSLRRLGPDLESEPVDLSELPEPRLFSGLAEDRHGRLWLALYGTGLLVLDGSHALFLNPTNSELPSSDITALSRDGMGNIWLSTFEGQTGFFAGPPTVAFDHGQNTSDKNVWDAQNHVWSLLETATRETVVSHLAEEGWQDYTIPRCGLTDDDYFTDLIAFGQKVFARLQNGGLARFVGSACRVFLPGEGGFPDEEIQPWNIDDDDRWQEATPAPSARERILETAARHLNEPRLLLQASDGSAWVRDSERLAVVRNGDFSIVSLTDPQGNPIRVLAMTEAPAGTIWIGTDGQGLARLDATGVRFVNEEIQAKERFRTSLSTAQVDLVAANARGEILASCTYGLLYFDGSRWELLDPPAQATAIHVDAHGQFWLEEPLSGLLKFSPENAL